MKIFIVIFFTFAFTVFPQGSNKEARKEYDKILSEQSKFIIKCEKETEAAQIKESGKILPKIVGECEWINNGCPINIVMPIYPKSTRKSNLSGVVKVEIIIHENGKVVFARAFEEKKFLSQRLKRRTFITFLSQNSLRKKVRRKKIIVYNFLPPDFFGREKSLPRFVNFTKKISPA